MYAAGTDLSKLPYTDTMQPNPAYKPQQNTQQNNQGYQYQGGMTPVQSQQPKADYSAYSQKSSSNPYGSYTQTAYQTPGTSQQMPGYQVNYQGQQSPYNNQAPNPYTTPTFTSQVQTPFSAQPMDPSSFFSQRDALISKLNDYSNGYAMQSGTSMDGSFGPPPVAPNFQNLWSQAGDMVNNGWQNPFAAPSGILSRDSYGTGFGEFSPETVYQAGPNQPIGFGGDPFGMPGTQYRGQPWDDVLPYRGQPWWYNRTSGDVTPEGARAGVDEITNGADPRYNPRYRPQDNPAPVKTPPSQGVWQQGPDGNWTQIPEKRYEGPDATVKSPVGQAQPVQPPSQGTGYQVDWDRIYRDRMAKEEQGRKIQAERDAQDQRLREYTAAQPRQPSARTGPWRPFPVGKAQPTAPAPTGTKYGSAPVLLAPQPKGKAAPKQQTNDERIEEYRRKGLLSRDSSFYRDSPLSADQWYFQEQKAKAR